MVEMGGRVEPGKLPRRRRAPVALSLEGKVYLTGEGHPSAMREMVIDLDRRIAIDGRGLPVCGGGRRDIRRPLRQIAALCHDAIVGHGQMDFELAFPEQQPVRARGEAIVFNAEGKRGSTKLEALAELNVPAPRLVEMSIEVRRQPGGADRIIARLPVVAGGSGSLRGFHLRIKRLLRQAHRSRSLVTARCPDGVFKLSFPKILFRNETHEPGVPPTTLMRGGLAIPCNPAG